MALSYSKNNSLENNATGGNNFTTKHCLSNGSTNVLANEVILNILLAEPHSSLLMFPFPKPTDVSVLPVRYYLALQRKSHEGKHKEKTGLS